MFEVDKPRRFHYEPRFYDPEKERWEALKKKYAMEKECEEASTQAQQKGDSQSAEDNTDSELSYFEQRVRDINQEERNKSTQLTWRDLFRKREMPKFNYQSRLNGITSTGSTGNEENQEDDESLMSKYIHSKRRIKIKRRFDISDTEYMKPVSGSKIILYCFIVFLLLYLIVMK